MSGNLGNERSEEDGGDDSVSGTASDAILSRDVCARELVPEDCARELVAPPACDLGVTFCDVMCREVNDLPGRGSGKTKSSSG